METSTPVTGYNVYRGLRSGGPYTKLKPTPLALTSYTDNAVQSGQTYFYVTTAINSKKNIETKYSTEVSAVIPIPKSPPHFDPDHLARLDRLSFRLAVQ
jgi:hypothetical protein